MDYDLELDKAISEIRKSKVKRVLLQLPDGLKPKALEIQEKIEKSTNAEVAIWLGTCFGACDLPHGVEKMGFDLVIQWGHSKWKF